MRNPLIPLALVLPSLAVAFLSFARAQRKYADMVTRVETLEARNAGLLAVCRAQEDALERIRAEAAAQTERLAKAQADAARTRARSEARVQTILAAPAPGDGQELAAWAAREAKDLSGRLGQ